MKNSDMPANPLFDKYGRLGTVRSSEGYSYKASGLTKREAFAVAAMQGYTSNELTLDHKDIAEMSVHAADALLKELDK